MSSSHCIRTEVAAVHHEVNLYSGIPDVVRLGDNETQFLQRSSKYKSLPGEIRIPANTERVAFSKMFDVAALGARVYFRNSRVALIELQEPFRGHIHGRKIQVFSFAAPMGTSWEEALIREFGTPQARASGGRFGSEAMFFFWGDISYNRMGPNQIALYRDTDISQWRQSNFGREMQLFK